MIITDGVIRKSGSVLFHMGSKQFLEDVNQLVFKLFGVEKTVKGYVQKGKFYSYQLTLNKENAQEILQASVA